MRTCTEYRVALPHGIGIHALEWSGTAPAVVLIHPNRTSNRVWDHTVAASRVSNRCIAPALRGHGSSDFPARGYRLTDHRDDLIAFLEARQLGAAIVAGQATGAMLALMIANARPDLVRAVIAANPALAIPSAVNDLVQTQVRAHAMFASREQARAALPFSSRWSQAVTEHYLDHALEPFTPNAQESPGSGGAVRYRWRYAPHGVAECEADLVNDYSASICTDRPVLLFGGAEATVLPSAIIDRVAALLPNHRRATLTGADHRLCQDNPAGFAALIDPFIEEHSA